MADEGSIGSRCDAGMTPLKRAAIARERYRMGSVYAHKGVNKLMAQRHYYQETTLLLLLRSNTNIVAAPSNFSKIN
jgi:hypothetical protein